MEILSVENLTFRYPKAQTDAVKDVSFCVEKGDVVLLCGETGCGKTTLLKLLKKEIAPFGDVSGKITFLKKRLEDAPCADIGFVFQDVESQIVCDKVWHELAFSLENSAIQNSQMKRRVSEMASYFGISEWFYKNTNELSGGQKQLLNLASVTVGMPKLILLDEPLSQLDPIACVDFVNTVKRLNDDFGITFIISEHRTQEILPFANKTAVMKDGKLISYGKTQDVLEQTVAQSVFGNFTDSARIWKDTLSHGKCPLTVRDGKKYLETYFSLDGESVPIKEFDENKENAFECKHISFRYSKNSPDVIEDLNFSCKKGEIHAILGANGSGKTTLVKILSGVLRAYKGKIRVADGLKTALLVQNVKNMFCAESISEDYRLFLKNLGLSDDEGEKRFNQVCEVFELNDILERHPYDLSGGELQKCAIAKLLMAKPDIVFMDEPVKSLDCTAKEKVARIIRYLSDNSVAVVLVTHDTDFAAEVADRCSLLFNGELTACDVPQRFFSDNAFYTTGASRMSRDFIKNAVTCEQVSSVCCGKEIK